MNYQQKYLKYKHKYLKLKQQDGGVVSFDTTNKNNITFTNSDNKIDKNKLIKLLTTNKIPYTTLDYIDNTYKTINISFDTMPNIIGFKSLIKSKLISIIDESDDHSMPSVLASVPSTSGASSVVRLASVPSTLGTGMSHLASTSGASTGVPSASTSVPSTSTSVPSTLGTGMSHLASTSGASTGVPSASTSVPSASTSVPSASTSVPSASTSVPSANLSVDKIRINYDPTNNNNIIVETDLGEINTGELMKLFKIARMTYNRITNNHKKNRAIIYFTKIYETDIIRMLINEYEQHIFKPSIDASVHLEDDFVVGGAGAASISHAPVIEMRHAPSGIRSDVVSAIRNYGISGYIPSEVARRLVNPLERQLCMIDTNNSFTSSAINRELLDGFMSKRKFPIYKYWQDKVKEYLIIDKRIVNDYRRDKDNYMRDPSIRFRENKSTVISNLNALIEKNLTIQIINVDITTDIMSYMNKIVVHQKDALIPICVEGENRSQLMFIVANYIRSLIGCNVFRPHGARGGNDPYQAYTDLNEDNWFFYTPSLKYNLDNDFQSFNRLFGITKQDKILKEIVSTNKYNLNPDERSYDVEKFTKLSTDRVAMRGYCNNSLYNPNFLRMLNNGGKTILLCFDHSFEVIINRLFENMNDDSDYSNIHIVYIPWGDTICHYEAKHFGKKPSRIDSENIDFLSQAYDDSITNTFLKYMQLFAINNSITPIIDESICKAKVGF
jgi:hypothetical protein